MEKYDCAGQEWSALRLRGIQTPQIAAWQRLPILPARTFANTRRKDAIYNYVLNVYRSPRFADVRIRSYKTLFCHLTDPGEGSSIWIVTYINMYPCFLPSILSAHYQAFAYHLETTIACTYCYMTVQIYLNSMLQHPLLPSLQIIMKDVRTGKKIFVVPQLAWGGGQDDVDPAFLADVASNSGRNDIIVQRMCTPGTSIPFFKELKSLESINIYPLSWTQHHNSQIPQVICCKESPLVAEPCAVISWLGIVALLRIPSAPPHMPSNHDFVLAHNHSLHQLG